MDYDPTTENENPQVDDKIDNDDEAEVDTIGHFNQAMLQPHIIPYKFFYIAKMVLLTIVAPSNPHTVYFDHDIANPNYIHLLSTSMYNSWYNLEENGIMSVTQSGTQMPAPLM